MIFSCDFETTTDPGDCRVWEWGSMELYNHENYHYGTDIDSFIEYIKEDKSVTKCYFHNLKFDIEFILHYLLTNGFKFVENKNDVIENCFSVLISDMGQVYTADICFSGHGKNRRIVKLIDSLKVIPMPVSKIPKAFGLDMEKLKIDYDEGGKEDTTEEQAIYLKRDCEIVAFALEHLFDQGMTKLTTASNAFTDYKDVIGKDNFKKWFPIPKYDRDIRQAYKGGFSYVNKMFAGKEIGEGIVLDVNSLYPWVMHDCPLPYGEGVFFEGQYKEDKLYNLYIQQFSCQFRLKPGRIPTIQLKNTRGFIPTEYIEASGDEYVTLCLTSVDLKLFFDQYEVWDIDWIAGWKFKSSDKLFKAYIDKWIAVKNQATIDGNPGLRTLAKLMLNALYGRFALNPDCRRKEPYIKEDGSVGYRLLAPETREAIYIPVGVFVTAWARNKTIRSAQANYERFIYADTDSLHLVGTEYPEGMEVDPVKLGAWKHESTFTRAKFLHSKCYIEEMNGELKVTVAGMPENCYSQVTYENFNEGASYSGKLRPRHVAGGIVLEDCDFTIRKMTA